MHKLFIYKEGCFVNTEDLCDVWNIEQMKDFTWQNYWRCWSIKIENSIKQKIAVVDGYCCK
jgi:hypothetical protein